jgi:hypothetical protein
MPDLLPDPESIDGWLEILEASEAELAAGMIVSGDEVIREAYESIARMEAKLAARREAGAI